MNGSMATGIVSKDITWHRQSIRRSDEVRSSKQTSLGLGRNPQGDPWGATLVDLLGKQKLRSHRYRSLSEIS